MRRISSSSKIKPLDLQNKPLPEGEKKKCECCGKLKFGCEWQEIGQYNLCLACKEKVQAKRVDELVAGEIARMEQGIFLDEAELKGLRSDGLIAPKTYVYLALRIEGVDTQPTDVDVQAFCSRWLVTKEDLLSAVAMLSKKGAMYVDLDKINSRLFTHSDRLRSLESTLKN